MDKLPIPIDWATVDWFNVGTLSAIVFVAALVGAVFSFGSRVAGTVLTTIFFAAFFVLWTYWLRDLAGGTFNPPPV